MISRVFTALPVKNLNIDEANRFGQLLPIFNADEKPPALWSEEFALAAMARLHLHKYNPVSDYILIAGPTVATTKVVAALSAEFGRINVLFFDAVKQTYTIQGVGTCIP